MPIWSSRTSSGGYPQALPFMLHFFRGANPFCGKQVHLGHPKNPARRARSAPFFDPLRLLRLKKKGRMHTVIHEQSPEPLVNYLRVHRRDAGFTQGDVGDILGYGSDGAVARHERFQSVPPFLMALGYEILFREPAGKIFLGLKQAMEPGIEVRIAELEKRLHEQLEKSPHSVTIARKLEWLTERRSSGYK